MSIPSFTQGFPPDNTTLGQTKSTMRDNLDGTFLAFSVDHRDQNESDPGYHKVIHLVTSPGNVNPAPISNAGQLYVRQIVSSGNIDETLFYESGGGRITQLTTNLGGPGNTFLNAVNGYTTLPGGLIFQWGIVGGSSAASVPVLFATANINFPNACYNVSAIPIRPSSSPGSDFTTAIVNGSVSNLGFTIANIGAHTQNGWYWTAIGN